MLKYKHSYGSALMRYPSCQQAYLAGTQTGAGRSLEPGSLYKLYEQYDQCDDRLWSLEQLGNRLRKNPPIASHEQLGCWTGADWREEVTNLPVSLSFNLGANVIPAIIAACGHAAATAQSQRFAKEAYKRAEADLKFYEQTRPQLDLTGLGDRAVRNRIGYAEWLLHSTRALVEDAYVYATAPVDSIHAPIPITSIGQRPTTHPNIGLLSAHP